jgi:hypothetical protein
VLQVGRLNNDPFADIIWVNVDGTVSAWVMQGRTTLRHGQLMPAGSGWTVAQLVDTNGDGSSELVWTSTSGNVGLWAMDWSTVTNNAFPQPARTPLLNAGNPWVPATSLEQNH